MASLVSAEMFSCRSMNIVGHEHKSKRMEEALRCFILLANLHSLDEGHTKEEGEAKNATGVEMCSL